MSDVDASRPQRTLITTRHEYLAALDDLLLRARRELCIFDPDLQMLDLGSLARSEMLARFLRADRDNRLLIALHDPAHLQRACPRMIDLLRDFSSGVSVQQTEGEAARAQDCFVLADTQNFVRRAVATQGRGVYALGEAREGHLLRNRFDEIWQSSTPAVAATTLGL